MKSAGLQDEDSASGAGAGELSLHDNDAAGFDLAGGDPQARPAVGVVADRPRHLEAVVAPQYSRDGITLRLSDRGAGAPGLSSPPVREDLFGRMVRVIAEKAERMQASGGQWLHVTVLTGLWAFTDWGRGSLPSKAPIMSSALIAALEDRCPAGIVLTSAPGLAPEGMTEETAEGPAGISLRISIQALRARESLILPLRCEVNQAANDWLSLARAEDGWLDWALSEKHLPEVGEMLVSER